MPSSSGVGREAAADRRAPADAPDGLLAEIFALAPIGIGIVDMSGVAVLTNDALRAMLGYSEEEFATLPFEVFTHPDDIARNDELFGELASGVRERFELDKRFFHRDGHIVWGRLLVSLIRDDAGRPSLAIGLLQDITEEKRLEEELRAAEATFRQLVEQVPAVVYLCELDPRAPWVYVSPRIEALLGYTPEECTTVPGLWMQRLDVVDRASTLARVDEHVRSGSREPITISYRMRRRDGELRWVRDQFAVEEEADGRRLLRGVLVDVTREKELEAELERQAFQDELTGLANLRRFRERVADRMERRPPRAGAVVFLDLDDFKTVNDSLGHGAGDRLLCEVAARLRANLRPADTAGRLGGDEFALLLDEVADRDDAIAIAERIASALDTSMLLDGHRVRPAASLGLAMLEDGGSTDAVLRAADVAMYHAKALGKGRLAVYDSGMLEAAMRRLREGTSRHVER
jgi:diguanylate cyclase (GGDEF)-like protein/PAS domain S-box-containing protein